MRHTPSMSTPDHDGLTPENTIDLAGALDLGSAWRGPIPFRSMPPQPQPVFFDFKAHPGPPAPCTQIAISTPSGITVVFIDPDEAVEVALGILSKACEGRPEAMAAAVARLIEVRTGLVIPGRPG